MFGVSCLKTPNTKQETRNTHYETRIRNTKNMPTQSKRFRALTAKVPEGKNKIYTLDQAVALLKDFGNTKFDQSVEIHVRTGIDPKQADQLVRGSIVLPNGIGKSLRVVVFAKNEL